MRCVGEGYEKNDYEEQLKVEVVFKKRTQSEGVGGRMERRKQKKNTQDGVCIRRQMKIEKK